MSNYYEILSLKKMLPRMKSKKHIAVYHSNFTRIKTLMTMRLFLKNYIYIGQSHQGIIKPKGE